MQNRTLIEQVKPEIEGGRYFAKRIIGETVDVTAAIFADGHDSIRASLLFKHEADKAWQEVPMDSHPNDEWSARFTPDKIGYYHYKLEAWIDHFTYWYKGFLKKYEAGQHLNVELLEGAALLKKTAAQYPKTKTKTLLAFAKVLENEAQYAEGVATVLSREFGELVYAFPLKQFATSYDKNLRVFVERKKAMFSTWYELFPRSAGDVPGQHGTFKDVERRLLRIASMGFDVLYLPPIHPIGAVNRKGKNNSTTAQPGEPGSPWAIGSAEGGHKAIHPELGTLEDYRRLIKTSNEMGLEVALDLAFQCAPDHPYVSEHPQWFVWRPDNSIMYAENPPKKYQDIVPLNFECEDWQNLWEELKSVVVYWIEQGVTIFRVDNPHTKPFRFWEWLIGEVKAQYPDIIFLSEAFSRPKIMQGLAKAGFTQSYSYFTWRNDKREMQQYLTELSQTESREYMRPNFWPNTPDILPYFLQRQNGHGENGFVLRLLLAATMSSNYGLYGPAYEFMDDVPYAGKEEYMDSEKYEIKLHDWNRRNRLMDTIAQINHIRRAQPALQDTFNIHFTNTNHEELMSYVKITPDGSNIIWCVASFNTRQTVSGYVEVPKALLGLTGGPARLLCHDLLTGQSFQWNSDWNFVALNPNHFPMHVMRVEVLR